MPEHLHSRLSIFPGPSSMTNSEECIPHMAPLSPALRPDWTSLPRPGCAAAACLHADIKQMEEERRKTKSSSFSRTSFSLLWGGRGGMGCNVQHTLTRGISSLCTDTAGYQSASPLTLAAWLNISFLLLTLKWVEPRRQNIWIPLGESERRTSTGSFSCWQ